MDQFSCGSQNNCKNNRAVVLRVSGSVPIPLDARGYLGTQQRGRLRVTRSPPYIRLFYGCSYRYHTENNWSLWGFQSFSWHWRRTREKLCSSLPLSRRSLPLPPLLLPPFFPNIMSSRTTTTAAKGAAPKVTENKVIGKGEPSRCPPARPQTDVSRSCLLRR